MRERRQLDFAPIGHESDKLGATRRLVTRVSLVIALVVAAVFPVRRVAVGLLPSVYVAYAIALVAGYGLTGLLLAWWARRLHDGRVGLLSATYLYCAALVSANVVLIVEPLRTPQSAEASLWLWLLWHAGLPFGILASTWRPVPALRNGVVQAALLAAGASALTGLFVWSVSPHVPLLVQHSPTAAFGIGCAVAAGAAALAAWRLWIRDSMQRLELLLMLVLVSVAGDLALVVTSPMGFSLGTYAARGIGLVSGLVVLWMMLRWMIAAVERSDALSHYVTIAETAPMLMFLTDEAGECIYANARVSEFTGQSVERTLGNGFLAFLHPEDAPRRAAGERWYTTEQHLRIRDRDGNYVWHLVRYAALQDLAGRRIGWIGTATNLDRERRLADELRRQYEREREMSNALQGAFLPRVLLPDVEGIGFTAVYRPIASTNQIGGDWYDAFALPNDVVVFTMGDVSGHGLSAGASMLRLREGLRMAALTERSPGRALALMNRMMLLEADVSATALIAFAYPSEGVVRVALAGHPRPILIRGGRAQPLPLAGIVLGATEDAQYDEFGLTLEAGDEIAFYTDGLIEGDKRPIEGEQRLFEALRDTGRQALHAMVDELLSYGQADDATIVLLSYRRATAAGWHFRADNADSAQSARAAFRYHLVRNGAQPDVVARAELVFGELVGNVVRHAPGPIEIDLARQSGEWILSVRDRGPGFESRKAALPEELLAEGGRGLFLVEAFSGASLAIVPRPRGGTKVVATIADPAAGAPSSDTLEFVCG